MNKSKFVIFSAITYLYIPIVIFLIGWIKVWIAVPVILITAGAIAAWAFFGEKSNSIAVSEDKAKMIPEAVCALITLALCVLWCMASGLGGFVAQTPDWYKHNILLSDLIKLDYPIVYSFAEGKGVLCYYIADYLPAAVLARILPSGKGGPFDTAQLILLLWTALGIFLAVLVLYLVFGRGRGYNLPLIFLGVFLFGTFICPLSGLFRVWFPEDVRDGVQWLSNAAWIQYSSNITLLSYVFPQLSSGLVASALFYSFRDKPEIWGLILAPLVLHSTFVFLGMAVLMGTVFLVDVVFSKTWRTFRKLFSPWNLASLPVLAVLLIYILGNFLQSKPAGSAMGFEMIDYRGHIWTLIVFELSWLLWIFLLLYPGREPSLETGQEPTLKAGQGLSSEAGQTARQREGDSLHKTDRVLLISVSISLFLYPFFTMGYYNDLCMRASIPALLVLCIMVIRRLVEAFPVKPASNREEKAGNRETGDSWYAVLLIICLLLTGLGSVKELTELYKSRNPDGKSYSAPYQSSEDFFMSNEFLQYQYVDWEPEGIISLVLKRR